MFQGDRLRAIIYMILLPLFFTILVGGILAQIFGLIDVTPIARNIPVVGGFLPEPREEPGVYDREEELDRWAEELERFQEELEAERSALESREDELEALEQDLKEQEDRLARREETLMDEEELLEDREQRLDETAAMYEEMRPGDAAEIMSELEDHLIIEILNRLPNDHKARILTEMDADKARELTRLLTD